VGSRQRGAGVAAITTPSRRPFPDRRIVGEVTDGDGPER